MRENKKKSNVLIRFILSSPWLPLIFVGIFALSIYAENTRIHLPNIVTSPRDLMIANNLCFLAVVFLRLIYNLWQFTREFRYKDGSWSRGRSCTSNASVDSVRAELTAAGFKFDKNGYGERRSFTLVATTIIYGGLLLAILVGTYDNMWSYSCVFVQGAGALRPLDDAKSYVSVGLGPFASLKNMPKFQVRKIIYNNVQWPKSAVELAIYDKNNISAQAAKGIVAKDGKPLIYKGLEYHLGRIIAEVPLQISTDNNHLEYEGTLTVKPLDPPLGNYTYYTSFKGIRLLWDLLYNPAGNSFKLLGGINGISVVNDDFIFGKDTAKQMGHFIAKIPWFSQQVEIHVVNHRHLLLVYLSLGITFFGILFRLLSRPQWVRLEEAQEGCRIWGAGRETGNILKSII